MERRSVQRTGGRRRRCLLPLGVAALLALGACSNGDDARPSAAEAPTTTNASTTSTTLVPATTVTTRAVTATSVATTVTTRRAQPSGDPRVVASPPAAAPETRVSITGTGFTAENWRARGVPLWLAGGPSNCDFFADADHEVTVTADGRLSGSFVVPSYGSCRQSSVGELPMRAGRYRIVYQCTACTIGEFEVTADAPPATARCQNVGFTPNSDDVAADIVAYGLSCAEAEAVVRKVAPPLGPLGGAATGEADGFRCVRVSEYEGRGLPSANYECTRGGQRITFNRT